MICNQNNAVKYSNGVAFAHLSANFERPCLIIVLENLKENVAIFVELMGDSFEFFCKYLIVVDVFSVVVGDGRLWSGGRMRIGGSWPVGSPCSASVHDLWNRTALVGSASR
ncbi:hypothetical protein HanIR_Chr05g0236431 [Helianthus annuus]|nr:hypothetical protein HanIR_Chr05g0236431 [Helianthus annuus]